MKRILITGGAGFLGSHLCERLLDAGNEVLCVDNLFTGGKRQIVRLFDNPFFEFMRHDVTFPLYVEVDEIYNLACPASPVHYQFDPVQTTKTSVHGAINMLGLAKRTPECRVFPRDTRRVRPAAAGTREMATTLFEAADVLRSQRRSTQRSATTPTMTRRRVGCALHVASASSGTCGPCAPAPLRPHARAYACRGLPASCFALPWRAAKAKIFQASTSEVYGDPQVHPQPESYCGRVNPIGPRSCYDEGKRCAETLFFDYHRQHGLDIKIARIFNTYGPNMHPNDGRVVSNFIVQALRGEDITIFGDGRQTRSFCYVEELIDGIVRLMKKPSAFTGPINLGNPEEFTVLSLAETVIALTDSRSQIRFRPLPMDDPAQRQPDISLAKRELQWSPSVSLEEGLARTIAYFERLLAENEIRAG